MAGLDLGTVRVFLEADAPRVHCREHGLTVAAVPWARHDAGHTRASTTGRVAGGAVLEDGGHEVDADRVAHGRGDRRPGLADVDGRRRSFRRAAPDRDRRDLLQAGTPLPDGGRRPRHRPAGVGRAGSGQGHPATVLRRPRPERCAQITHVSSRRWPTGSHVVVRARLPERDALRRPVPRRAVGHRGPRRGPPRRPGTTPATRRRSANAAAGRARRHATQRSSTPATRCGRTPRTSPTTSRPARLDRQDRPRAAPGLPAQRRPPLRLRSSKATPAKKPSTGGSAGPAAAASPPSSTCTPHRQTPRRDRRRPRPSACPTRLIESTNTKIRLLTRIAFGFHIPDALIALAMLTLGGHRPASPAAMTHGSRQESQISARLDSHFAGSPIEDAPSAVVPPATLPTGMDV